MYTINTISQEAIRELEAGSSRDCDLSGAVLSPRHF